jgi:hypothetical protein
MTTNAPPNPTTRRRWLQFSLRTLMVLVLLASVAMSWLAVKMQRAKRQREAANRIVKLGGSVTYDYEVDASGQRIPNTNAPGPTWLRRLLGQDFFADVVQANLDSTEVTDAELEFLNGLPRLRWLNLFNTQVTDAGLKHLEPLGYLQRLELGGASQITDAGLEHLEGLHELWAVYLGGTQVTEEGEKRLQQALPNLRQ